MSAAAAEARLHTLLLIELLAVLGSDEGDVESPRGATGLAA